MKKNIVIIFTIALLSYSRLASAQTFVIEPRKLIDTTITSVWDKPVVEMNAYVRNISPGNIQMRWVLIKNDFSKANIDYTFCDPFQCRVPPIPDSSTFDVATGTSGNFKFDPTVDHPLSGDLQFKVFDINQPAIYDTITFRINASTAGLRTLKSANWVKVYPTVAHDELTISGISGNSTVFVVEPAGKTSKNLMVSEGKLNISALPAGVYYLRVIDRGNVSNVPFVKE